MTDLRNETMLILGDLIGFPTVTSDSNRDLIAYAESKLAAVGATVSITRHPEEDKANLLATIGPAVDGGVVLSGHTDVVPADEDAWTGAPFVAMRRDQRIYGRGAVDMKGFIACVLAMAPAFAATDLRRPVHIALTFDEEVGCRGAPILVSDLLRTGPVPAAAIVGEPTEMSIIDAHKGCYEYTTTITGLAGHGSAPSLGVNAVQVASRYVS
ncbi:MAG: M20/M25/M40 family metallo-hydrolase, partial [Acidimicrobiia bacterium]